MAGIKIKTGKCLDCGPDSTDKPLTAGRCNIHYWKHRSSVKAANRKYTGVQEDKNAQKKALDIWFANQINQLPKYCENCGEYLNQYAPWGAKAYIAHIVPKRNFKSVMLHPLNRLFLCVQCHTNYDNWPSAKIVKMKIYPIAVERMLCFIQQTQFEELSSLPEHFIKIVNDEYSTT